MIRRFRARWLVIAITVVVGIAGLLLWYRDYHYPYGPTHACDLQLWMELQNYAESNKGFFPSGQATPEASLSLLHQNNSDMASLLAGKTAPVSEAERLIAAGKPLTPETCSWHYVHGLHKDDNPRLVLFWDKIGLGHNGQRMPSGGHSVMLLGGQRAWVSPEEWPSFLKEQEKLLPKRPDISPAALQQR